MLINLRYCCCSRRSPERIPNPDLSLNPPLTSSQLDEKGSTAVLLHMSFHVTGKRHIYCFACTGDTEAYTFDSAAGHWRYLIELIGASPVKV